MDYVIDKSVKDGLNIDRLKEELGIKELEIKMFRELTRGNTSAEEGIKNKFQNDLYNDVKRFNNLSSVFFLYFFHIFYWRDRPTDAKDLTTNAAYNTALAGK